MKSQNARRRRGLRGTVLRRGTKWSYVIDVDPDPVAGKLRQRWSSGYAGEDEAWDAFAEVNQKLRDGSYVKPVSMTVAEFLARWLDAIKVEVKPTTHANYTALANAYVIPYVGHRRMQDIQPQVVSELYRRLLNSGRRKRDTNSIMFEHWQQQTRAGGPVTAAELAGVGEVGYSTAARALERYRAGRLPSGGRDLSATTTASVHIMLRAAFNDAAGKAWNLIPENPVPHAPRPRIPRNTRSKWRPSEPHRLSACGS